MNTALVWFRKDLRLDDNPAFFEACTHYEKVIPLYIFDGKNSVLGEAQAWWLHHSLISLSSSLAKLGLKLILRKGNPLEILLELISTVQIKQVFWNRCYEPKCIERDKKIKATLQKNSIDVISFNGSLLNEPWTISNKNGDFFKIFTPYWKTCRPALTSQPKKILSNKPRFVDVASDALQDLNLLPHLDWASRLGISIF